VYHLTIVRPSGADGFFYATWDDEGPQRADTHAKMVIDLLENGWYRVEWSAVIRGT
jgi:hypothetical protein